MAREPYRWNGKWVYPSADDVERPFKPAEPRSFELPKEQGARSGQYVVPFRPDMRSNRGKPLPWGPGTGGRIIENDAYGGWSKWDIPDEQDNPWSRQWNRAKKAARDAEQLSQLFKTLNALDTLEGFTSFATKPFPSFKISGWTKCDGDYPPTPDHNDWDGIFSHFGAIDCAKGQLTGQAYDGDFFPMAALPNGATLSASSGTSNQLMMQWGRPSGYGCEQSSWLRNPGNTSTTVDLQVYRQAYAVPATNPNVERMLAPYPQPMGAPTYPTAQPASLSVPWTQEVAAQLTGSAARFAAAVPARFAYAMGATSTATGTRGGGIVRVPVTPREPPPTFTKEGKTLTRAAQIGIMLFKALDFASEMGDIVDAVYEALPDKVKKRRPCKSRGGVDQFGQYGINAADCKLAVLYDNWHLLDTGQAVVNIVKNELEDKAYGAIHKHLPKQAGGPAMGNSWQAFGQMMKKLGF